MPEPAGEQAGQQQGSAAGEVEQAEGGAFEVNWGGLGHQRREDALAEPHVQAPEGYAGKQQVG
ncbi:hypothetical protein D3C76_1363780 [compost metagenome]